MTTRTAGRGLRPGEELLRAHRSRLRQRIRKGAWAGSVPLAIFAAITVVRLGAVAGLSAVAAGCLIAGLVIGWLLTTYGVVVGPGYIRVHNGLRYREFRPGPDLHAVRVATVAGVLETAGTLYLRQGRRRASVLLGAEDHQRVIDVLGVTPYETNQTPSGFIGSLPPELRGVLPYWQRHPVATALEFTAVVVVLAVILGIWWVGHGNATYRAGATRRLDAFAAARFDHQAGWEPQGPARLGWEGDTDHEPLRWERTYAVPFGDKKSFLAAWTTLTGDAALEPDCITDAYHGVKLVTCEAGADMSFDRVPLFVDAEFQSGAPGHHSTLDLAVIDHRD